MRRVECILTDDGKIEYAGRTYTSDTEVKHIINEGILARNAPYLMTFMEEKKLIIDLYKIGFTIYEIAELLLTTSDEIKSYL